MEQTINPVAACPECGSPLRISKSNANKGHATKCIVCYRKKWYGKNRARVLADSKEYYKETAPIRRKLARQFYHANSPEQKKTLNRRAALKRKYGITVDDYERMFLSQNGLCFLCGVPPRINRPLSIDHCHVESRVRRLLCEICNLSLGVIERDPTWVNRALRYLKEE